MVETSLHTEINEPVEKSMAVSVYVDFSHEIKRKTGWELLPDNTVYDYHNYGGKPQGRPFDYIDTLKFLEYEVITSLESELKRFVGNNTIRIEITRTNLGSIELILAIYGVYASINDFIETTNRILDFTDRYVPAQLSNRFGSYFTTQTNLIAPTTRGSRLNFDRFMLAITALISILTVGVLYTFSFNFISRVVLTGGTTALFLAAIIELSKITTTYHLVYVTKKRVGSSRITANLNRVVRVVAIILSSLFCLAEIAEINTAPNLEAYRAQQLDSIEKRLAKESAEVGTQYDDEINRLTKQIVVVSKPSVSRRYSSTDYSDIISNNDALNSSIAETNIVKAGKLNDLKAAADREKKVLEAGLSDNPEVNSKKINSILSTVFNVPLNGSGYKNYYRYFVIFSSLLITLLVEMISIVSMQSISDKLIT